MSLVLRITLVICSCLSPAFSQPGAKPSTQRPLTPEDLERMEQIGPGYYSPFSFSPDGRYLAYVLVRARATAAVMQQPSLLGGDRSDIWLADTSTGKATNITKGESDSSGYFMPLWSPDGARLAMLSTRGGNVRLWVWEKASGQIRMLTERAINLWYGSPFIWVSNERLICSVLAEGERPKVMNYLLKTPEIAMREWPKAQTGKEPTASVVDSSSPVRRGSKEREGELLIIDAASQKQRVISTGDFRSLSLSPNRKYVAFLKRTGGFRPDGERPLAERTMLRFATLGYQAMISDTDGNLITSTPVEVENVYWTAWSDDGARLAIISEQPHTAEINTGAYIYTVASRSLHKAVEDVLDPFALTWSSKGELLVLANWKNRESIASDDRRVDWWIVPREGPARQITAGMKSVPALAVGMPGGAFVGASGGDLWQVAAEGTTPRKLSVGLDGQITRIAWPGPSDVGRGPFPRLVVEAKTGESKAYYLIDLATGSKVEIRKPSEAARLIDFNLQSNTAVETADTRSGTYLWLSRAAEGPPQALVETNTFLKDIAEGERRQIRYSSLDGRNLKAWLILPPGYREGKKYPLITWVYPGLMYGDTPPANSNLNLLHSLNLQLLAAHGYAVLLPSTPLKPPGQVSEVYMEMLNGTMPAVDKVIEMGIADPKRLGVAGHSWGGFATYCLITLTNRFQAAASMAGASDYASYYGTLDATARYTEEPQDFFKMFDIEGTASINLRMGKPPWKDMGYYLRNSPMFYVERVETPVMINELRRSKLRSIKIA